MFMPLSKCKFKMFGLDRLALKGWNYVNLGMGNHLIVKNDMIQTLVLILLAKNEKILILANKESIISTYYL